MVRTCPSCGRQAIDDQSQFCNKCGAPFPAEEQPRKVLVRTTPRLADAPPQYQQQPVPPPVPEPRAPPVPPARSLAETPARPRPGARAPARKPARDTGARSPAPALTLVVAKKIRLAYWLGVIAIVLIVFAGISTPAAKTATAADAGADAAADTEAKASTDLLSGIPLFWIGVFLFAILLWRSVCEAVAIQVAIHDSAAPAGHAHDMGEDFLFEAGVTDDSGEGEFTECPRCGKTVARDDLRICAHCGVQGCSSCIRLMGLVRKTLTCRDCYQK